MPAEPESPLSKLERLLGSMETLAGREEMLVKDRLLVELGDLQERMFAVSAEIARISGDLKQQGALPPELRAHADRIMARQKASLESLKQGIEEAKEKRKEIAHLRTNLGSLRNAYGSPLKAKKSSLPTNFNGQG